jgi:hypothetical protein
MGSIDFLKQGVKHVRKSIKDIDDSYNNDWDIIAELCQNSVDAIRKSGKARGTIRLSINSQNKTISVFDDGVGIAPDRLPELLAPFSTDKEDDEETIGEKGVGLTFVLFACNDFYIKSGNKDGSSEAFVFDAFNWKNSVDNNSLALTHNAIREKFAGTEVVLKKVAETSLFQLSFNQLKYLIRTKTALGNTTGLWENDIPIDVEFSYTNADGKNFTEALQFIFWSPIEGLQKNSVISIQEFEAFIAEKDRTDQEKRLKLKDKIIYKKDVINHNGRTLKYYAFLVPKRKTWDDLTMHFQICTQEQLDNDTWLERFNYVTFHPGITASVKGMPTGISIEPPITGAQGAWAQMFMLFEDRQLKFDIGRKAIHGMTARIYKSYAKDIFNEFRKLAKYISGEVLIESEWNKDAVFSDADKLIPINYKNVKLIKTPKDQEASVAGLFFECIGNGTIKDIDWLLSGYRNKYDLLARINKKNVIIEFKARLQSILKDFNDEVKMFNEVDCVVCWNVTEEDKQVFRHRGIDVEEIELSFLPGAVKPIFVNATHRMILAGGLIAPIHVIDLKMVLDKTAK